MSLLSSEKQKRRLFLSRLRILSIVTAAIFLILIMRIAQWTLFRRKTYQEKAKNNYIHPQRLDAPRGQIFSRDHHPLAVNRRTYSVWISPFQVSPTELHRTVLFLEGTLKRDFSVKEEKALSLRPRWRRKLLARNLSIESVTPILERKWDLPGLRVTADYKRYYPEGEAAAHVVGYLGRISGEKWKEYREKGYAMDDLIGIAGIERQYEDLVKGIPGREIVQRDARGRFCKVLSTQPAVPGRDLYLTMDLDFQKFARFKLGKRWGVILAMNPRTGDILVMASYPGYDSNYPAMASKPSRPVSYLNKAIQENYPPASTFKLVTAVAGVESGISPEHKYLCEGYYYLPGWKRPFKCDNTSGHGVLDLSHAIEHSCNIYFYRAARKMGPVNLLRHAAMFGYGTRTGIDLPFEIPGHLPIQSADDMYPGNLLNISIGQGDITATPLQVLCSYCLFANGGRMVKPHLLGYLSGEGRGDHHNKEWRRIDIPSEGGRAILKGLVNVVDSRGGTAHNAGFQKEWKVAGKTGTAERSGREDDAWFVCFAPYDDPEVAVLVMIEEGGFGGSTAAPLAREILEYYFLNRERLLGE